MTGSDRVARPAASASLRAPTASVWAELIGVLSAAAGSAQRLDAVLAAAVELLDAESAAVVRWAGGRSQRVAVRGTPPEELATRLAEGRCTLDGRPAFVASVDPRTDLVVVGDPEAEFATADSDVVAALTALLRWSGAVGDRQLQLLRGFAARVASTLEPQEILAAAADAAATIVGGDIAGVFTPDAAGGRLHMRAMVGNAAAATASVTLGTQEGLGGLVFSTGDPHRIDDYSTDPRSAPALLELSDVEGTCSAIGVPMRRDDAVEGVLCVWRRRREAFTDADEEVLFGLADLLARELHNATLHARMLRRLADAEAELSSVRDALTDARTERDHLRGVAQRAADAAQLQTALNRVARESSELTSLLRTVSNAAGASAAVVDVDGRLEECEALAAPRNLGAKLGGWLSGRDGGPSADEVTVVDLGVGWMLVAPVRAVGITLGHLALGVASAPTPEHRHATQHAALAAAALLSRQEATISAIRRAQADFVWDLLEGRLPEDVGASLGVQHVGAGFSLPARVVALSLGQSDDPGSKEPADLAERERERARLGRRITSALANAGYRQAIVAARADSFAVLVPMSGAADGADRAELSAVLRDLPRPGEAAPLVGIGGLVAEMGRFPAGWAEACLARSAATPGQPAAFEDLGVLQFLLAPTSRADLDSFAERRLGTLVRYDAEHGTELVPTLSAYLAADCNTRRTAEVLYVHHRTVTYRLGRIEELAGVRLRSTEDLLELQLALKILGLTADGNHG